MNQLDEFLATTLPRVREADMALHNGDAGLRMAMWSHDQSVTLFGAAMAGVGWSEIEPVFERLGASFSGCESWENEIIAAAASEDLAYTVAYERTTASVHHGHPMPYMLRVTTVFRHDGDDWKVVHRHADAVASSNADGVLHQLTSGPEASVQP
jgi:ketosteroid isomerase-like protein